MFNDIKPVKQKLKKDKRSTTARRLCLHVLALLLPLFFLLFSLFFLKKLDFLDVLTSVPILSLKFVYKILDAIRKMSSTFSPVFALVSTKNGILFLALKSSAWAVLTSLCFSLSLKFPTSIMMTSGSAYYLTS
jgi:hypothetical protein